jgi:hypothetical protein
LQTTLRHISTVSRNQKAKGKLQKAKIKTFLQIVFIIFISPTVSVIFSKVKPEAGFARFEVLLEVFQ